MKKEMTELTDLKAREVSIVDAGANLKKRFPVTKQQEETVDDTMQEILKAVLETEVDEEAKLEEYFEKANMSDKAQTAVRGVLRTLSAYKDEMPKDVLEKLSGLAGYPAPKEKAVEPPKKEEDEDMNKDVKKEAIKQEEVKKEMSPEVEEIFKAQKLELEELKKANEASVAALKVEKDKRELAEWVTKAENDLSHYPGKSSMELGEMLKGLHDVDPEGALKQFELLKGASDTLKESNILKEAGDGNMQGGVSGSAWQQIEKMAEGLVEKSTDAGFTKEKAIALVMKRNPAVYQQYLDENPAQTEGR